MSGATWLVLSAALAAMLAVAGGYSTGAPAKDCWTDRPLHGSYLPAHDNPPYEILLTKIEPDSDPDTYSPGEMINVTIRSRDGTPFKGYLMKVYSSNGVSRGVWGARKNKQHVLKKCGVTHDNNTLETQTTILWLAPKLPLMDNIQFKAIVVKDYRTFYNNILSRPLKPNYPTQSFDRLFKRLVAYASRNFNVTVPSGRVLSGTKTAITLDTSSPAAASGTSQTGGAAADTTPAGDSAMATQATSAMPASGV